MTRPHASETDASETDVRDRPRGRRRGSALLLVIVLVGAVLALSLTFLNAAATEVAAAGRADTDAVLRGAARAGLAAGLADLERVDARAENWGRAWRVEGDGGDDGDGGGGVRVADGPAPPDRVDARGTLATRVRYEVRPAPAGASPWETVEAALTVHVLSAAVWDGADGARQAAAAAVRVRLAPRTGGAGGATGGGADDRRRAPLEFAGGGWREAWDEAGRDHWAAASAAAVSAAAHLPEDGDGVKAGVALAPQARVAGGLAAKHAVVWRPPGGLPWAKGPRPPSSSDDDDGGGDDDGAARRPRRCCRTCGTPSAGSRRPSRRASSTSAPG